MVGNSGTLMPMRLIRSKLRKREEVSSTTTPTANGQDYTTRQSDLSNNTMNQHNLDQQILTSSVMAAEQNIKTNSSSSSSIVQEHVTFTRTSGCGPAIGNSWVFPPKAPSPNIYNGTVNEAAFDANENAGFKGLRKQFSGRFKRLVTKKPMTAPAIPPELKPQLKTIYVY